MAGADGPVGKPGARLLGLPNGVPERQGGDAGGLLGAIPSQSDHALSRAKAPVACICRNAPPQVAAHAAGEGLHPRVAQGVRLLAAGADRVRHAPRRPAGEAGRDRHADIRRVPHALPVGDQPRDEGAVLAQGNLGHAADREVGVAGHGQGRADGGAVAGPGIVRIGVDPRLGLGDEPVVDVLQPAPGMEHGGQELALLDIEFDPPGHGIRAGLDGGERAGHPVRRDAAVGVGGEDRPAGLAEPRGGLVHRLAAGPAGMGAGEVLVQHPHGHRQRRQQAGDDLAVPSVQLFRNSTTPRAPGARPSWASIARRQATMRSASLRTGTATMAAGLVMESSRRRRRLARDGLSAGRPEREPKDGSQRVFSTRPSIHSGCVSPTERPTSVWPL